MMAPSDENATPLDTEAIHTAASFFALPSPVSDPEYQDVGNTETSWTPGYFRYIAFLPWEDFDTTVWKTAMNRFHQLNETAKSPAGHDLNTARAQIVHGNDQDRRSHERAAMLGERDNIKRAEEVETPIDANDEEEEVEAAQLNIVSANERYWTNAASISSVCGVVSTALEYLFLDYLGDKARLYNLRCKREKKIVAGELRTEDDKEVLLAMQQSIVADVSLQLELITGRKRRRTPSAHSTRILPLCNFEMKGPTLDLSGLDATRRWVEKQKKKQGARKGCSTQRGREVYHAVMPSPPETLPSPETYNAKQVASNLNFLFSDPSFLNTSDRSNGCLRDSIYRVSQTVTNAVLSLGRCALLHNMRTGIGFMVEEKQQDKLIVKVTGVMGSNTSPNCVSAMFAIGVHCIDMYFSQTGEKLPSKVIDVAVEVARRATRREEISSKSSHELYLSSGGFGEGESEDGSTEGSPAQEVLSFQTELGSDFMSLILGGSGQSQKVMVSPVTVRPEFCKLNAEQISAKIDKALMHMFMHHDRGIAKGSSGIVLKSRLVGKEVAVKIAYDNCPSGTAALRREIQTYLDLRKERSPLLGDSLPRLVLGWDEAKVNSVYSHLVFLVTEYVGHALLRNEEGKLLIGDSVRGYEKVDTSEEPMICASALRGLQRMQQFGWLHGDVAMRNLRAERKETGSGVIWKIWWVDLGFSSKIQSRMGARLCALDRMHTRSLFLN